MALFGTDLKYAIVNGKYTIAEDSYKLLLTYYDALSNDRNLSRTFEQLIGYYQFLKNDGYLSVKY
jgi:hypothetical protein